jgi:hypothetical protein
MIAEAVFAFGRGKYIEALPSYLGRNFLSSSGVLLWASCSSDLDVSKTVWPSRHLKMHVHVSMLNCCKLG